MDMHPTPSRRAQRASVVALGLALGLLATPALAAPPEAWPDTDNGSALQGLLVFVGIPLGVVLLIVLLVYLPSMMRGQSSELAFQQSSEWFGGPRAGVDAATGGTDSHAPTFGRPAGQGATAQGAGTNAGQNVSGTGPVTGPGTGSESTKGGAGGQW